VLLFIHAHHPFLFVIIGCIYLYKEKYPPNTFNNSLNVDYRLYIFVLTEFVQQHVTSARNLFLQMHLSQKKYISDVPSCGYFIQYNIDSSIDLLHARFSPLHLPIHFAVNLNITFNAVFLHLLTTSNFFYLTTQTMTEHVTQPINNADSDSDVRHRRILRESIDCRFYRCSPRNKKKK
jgi:hypothetical protein